tara:strand:+ start:1519 stop:2517 length:999 start_codon:yes stop_codon:yes gene_type:complete
MAKFLDKKEQVFDLKLTSYGHYLMSIGKFKPVFYSFYDDNILYDKKYAHSASLFTENQNDIDNRIDNTQYLESLVLFRDVEETLNNGEGASDWYDQTEITARQQVPTKDVFRLDTPLGDALIEGDTNKAPAWKVVSLQSVITSIDEVDSPNDSRIPQLNIDAVYVKKVRENQEATNRMSSELTRTSTFEDSRIIVLEEKDPLYYIEEVNTQLLTKNFEIEIFQVLTSSNLGNYEQLERKYFKTQIPQVQNGFLVSETPQTVPQRELTTDDVEYYFDLLIDSEVDQEIACRGASFFNKKSYYVDLDFDCTEKDEENVFYDIYGTVTEPEVCLD